MSMCALTSRIPTRIQIGKPEQGYTYDLDDMTGRWRCWRGSIYANVEKGEKLVLVPNEEVERETAGFTAYDAKEVNFRLEDGEAMFMTDEDVLQPGWHRWKYNENRGRAKWAKWSDEELMYKTTITGWTAVRGSGTGNKRGEAYASSRWGESVIGRGVGGAYTCLGSRSSGNGKRDGSLRRVVAIGAGRSRDPPGGVYTRPGTSSSGGGKRNSSRWNAGWKKGPSCVRRWW